MLTISIAMSFIRFHGFSIVRHSHSLAPVYLSFSLILQLFICFSCSVYFLLVSKCVIVNVVAAHIGMSGMAKIERIWPRINLTIVILLLHGIALVFAYCLVVAMIQRLDLFRTNEQKHALPYYPLNAAFSNCPIV